MEEVELYEEVLLSFVDKDIIEAGMWNVPNLKLSVGDVEPWCFGYPAHSLHTTLTELTRHQYCM